MKTRFQDLVPPHLIVSKPCFDVFRDIMIEFVPPPLQNVNLNRVPSNTSDRVLQVTSFFAVSRADDHVVKTFALGFSSRLVEVSEPLGHFDQNLHTHVSYPIMDCSNFSLRWALAEDVCISTYSIEGECYCLSIKMNDRFTFGHQLPCSATSSSISNHTV